MTITITKTKLALSILVAALLVPATAWASHVFDDVPDDKFYAGPVEWAYDNNITTGKTATSFAPDDNVTRGESVTFLQRYNDNIVQPGIESLQAADTALEDAIAALPEYLWATVAPGGDGVAIVRGRGAESTTKLNTGYFSVVFERDVSECTWVASYGEPDNAGVDAQYATVRGGLTPEEVRVVLRNSDGAQADGDGFHLIVVCEPLDTSGVANLSAPTTPATDPNLSDG